MWNLINRWISEKVTNVLNLTKNTQVQNLKILKKTKEVVQDTCLAKHHDINDLEKNTTIVVGNPVIKEEALRTYEQSVIVNFK